MKKDGKIIVIKKNTANIYRDLLIIVFLSMWLGVPLFIKIFIVTMLKSSVNTESLPPIYYVNTLLSLLIFQLPVGIVLAIVFVKLKSLIFQIIYFITFTGIALYLHVFSLIFLQPLYINSSFQISLVVSIDKILKMIFALPLIVSFTIYFISILISKLTKKN